MTDNHSCYKLYFKDAAQIRRIGEPIPPPNWDEFNTLLESVFPELFHRELTVQYQDEESDYCTVQSEVEWKEANRVIHDQKIKKITISGQPASSKVFFKDGPANPEKLYFYDSKDPQQKEIPIDTTLDQIGDRVTNCLKKVLQKDRILPFHLPEWLRTAVKSKRVGHSEADLDIDIVQLRCVLIKQGINLLDQNNFSQAALIFESVLELNERDNLALYNLACTLSRAGKVDDALDQLEKAVACGFLNFAHIKTDSDLELIRTHERFLKLIPAPEQPQPVKPIEEVKQQQPVVQGESDSDSESDSESESETDSSSDSEAETDQKPECKQQTVETVEQQPKKVVRFQTPGEEETVPFDFEDALKFLHEMGFKGDDYLKLLLVSEKGNLEKVLTYLIK
jgi:tetratricopeptide (TPR) repeat protein